MSASDAPACRRCGCPLAGNESYCSNCGRRVDRVWTLPRLLAAVALLAAFIGVGTCVFASRHPPPAHTADAQESRTALGLQWP